MTTAKHIIFLGNSATRPPYPSDREVNEWAKTHEITVIIGELYGNYLFNNAEAATMFKLTYGGSYHAPLQKR